MARPINIHNAIFSASFVLNFNREFTSQENEAMAGVTQLLVHELPKANEMKRFNVNLDGTKQKAVDVEVSGLMLQSFIDGKLSWELKVMHDTVVATCKIYGSWTKEKETAIKYLKTVLRVLDQSDNLVNIVSLQITDRFTSAAVDKYYIGEVFNTESEFLNKNILTQGELWHLFQGWFDTDELSNVRCLNVLNVSTNIVSEHVSTVEHAIQYQMLEAKPASFFEDDDVLGNIFDILHGKNKEVVIKLLSDDQLKKIGLI